MLLRGDLWMCSSPLLVRINYSFVQHRKSKKSELNLKSVFSRWLSNTMIKLQVQLAGSSVTCGLRKYEKMWVLLRQKYRFTIDLHEWSPYLLKTLIHIIIHDLSSGQWSHCETTTFWIIKIWVVFRESWWINVRNLMQSDEILTGTGHHYSRQIKPTK